MEKNFSYHLSEIESFDIDNSEEFELAVFVKSKI